MRDFIEPVCLFHINKSSKCVECPFHTICKNIITPSKEKQQHKNINWFWNWLVMPTTIWVLLIITSCNRKEIPVPKFDRGSLVTRQVEQGNNYKNQVWYRLYDDTVVAINLKKDWDFALNSQPDGWEIVLNTAKAMKASQMNTKDLKTIVDTTGFTALAKVDSPSGNNDRTAIGDWRNNDNCYIINRGYDENGRFQGFIKIKFKKLENNKLYFEYADVYGKQILNDSLVCDPNYDRVYYSFSFKKKVAIEPVLNQYDLCFTQYTTFFYDPFMYYQVTGVLTSGKVGVMKISDKVFSQINSKDTIGRKFSFRKDAIGYDWKSYNLNTNFYTVDDKLIYLIKDQKGFLYKLHFVGFYNSNGDKGYPKFEFLKL